jgi:SAM-dependent methyltransferase
MRDPERIWRDANPSEAEFWKRELPHRVARYREYQLRADPAAPVSDPLLKMLLARIPETEISMIDVGAGPLTALGKTYPGKTLTLTSADPMANEYAQIMQEAGIQAPVPPVACRGEDLLNVFEPNSFDIAFGRNAIDHCLNPVRVITNMVHLVKPGRFVVLRHNLRVGELEFYRGEHQWNFDVKGDEFVIWRPHTPQVDMGKELIDLASVTCFQEHGQIVCLITKHPEPTLRRENQTLRMEREMLEKASAFFARETDEP